MRVMAAAVSWILRITLLASVPFLQVDTLTGSNVCSRTTIIFASRLTCAFNTFRGCCVWRYIAVCIYSTTYYCCPGWSQTGNTCSTPICSSGCYNGQCTSPGVCTCDTGYYGNTCNNEKSCSSVKPCFPGICHSYNNCDCENKFSGTYCLDMSIEPTITLATAKLAYYSSTKDVDIYSYTVDATNVVDGVNTIWTNLKQFNRFTAQLSGYLDLSSTTIPSQPSYILNFDIGISSASLYWELVKEKTDGTGTYVSDSSTVPCNQSVSEKDPATGLLNCYLIKDNFDRTLDTGDVLTLSFRAQSGGYEDLDSKETKLFNGTQTSNTVKFLVDYESPIAPSAAINIFHVVSDITKNAITTIWSGWTDTRSGMGRYNWEVFQMETIGDELRELNSAYLSPYESKDFNSTADNSYSYSFTPPSAGVYSLILEAADNANNSKYVRRFFIYDPISNVSVTTSCLKALSGLSNTSYRWQLYTESENIDVQLGWDGCFTNALHVTKGFLYKIQDYPPQILDQEIPDNTEYKKVIDTDLSDPTANRTSAAIDNVAGIVKFECQFSMGTGTTEPSEWISKSLSLNHTFSLSTKLANLVTDGYFIRLWTRATDAMGNTAVESMLLGFDNSPPVLYTKTYYFTSNVDGSSFKYGSRVVFDVEDDHSGIAEIEFHILNGDILLHKGTVEPNTTAKCTNKEFCYCLSNGICFNKEHRIAINNCWMRTPSSSTVTAIQLLLIAKNGAMLTSTMEKQITTADSLSGIGDYHGPENVEVLAQFAQGISIGWNFTEGCYTRQQIKLIYTDAAGVDHEKDVSANATRSDLVSLQPSTSYNVSVIIVYDQGDVSDPVIFQFTTSADVIQSQSREGIATGSIAGIVAVLLLLFIFLLAILVLYKTGRLRKVQQTVIVPIRNSVRRNRKSGIVGYRQYNTGGYDEEDIYMYGEMAFDKVWHYKMEDLELDSLIKVGRFARIYKAKLYRQGRLDVVVAKTLKDEYSEEESVLMKAKINFFGTKVGEHACLMGFIGAITDDSKMGPIMLLEYCELGPLRDWLLEHKTGVTDDTVERIFRFSFDIARGMQYLAGKEIIHMRLAARNIFITSNFEAKIAGFGPRHGSEEDETAHKERVPIKWIAPECLNTEKTATEKSDVWSYGITIWEIFSMGENPYPEVRSKDLFKWLRRGKRMSKPEYSDDLHFEIMKKCWKMEADARPNFTEIVKEIESLYRQSSGDQYYYRQ